MTRPDPRLKDDVLAYLRRHHADMCRHWFDEIEPVADDGGELHMLVREQVQLRYLRRCCSGPFTEAVQQVTGRLMAVRFVGEDELRPGGESDAPDGPSLADDMLLSPDYSFDNFVVGPDNQLAHAAAVAVAQKPGKAYNPFFIHSGVGLGKTHLLHAICQTAMRNDPGLKVYYTSCDGFMTQFMESVQQGHMSEFRNRFRGVDLLVIDDIHDLSRRERTQEEFFHTFNALYQAGKQIVLSSDAAPSEIPDLEERLTSRFNCGLVARIDRPCYETRVSIVKMKAQIRGIELPDDVASYVAARIDSNIRELEGAITSIRSLTDLDGHERITLELAKRAVGGPAAAAGGGSLQPTIQEIIDAITRYYDVKLTDLLSRRRHKSIALPRQVGMWLARKHTRYSLEEIGGYFGGRDHTTVMHAVRSIDSKRAGDNGLDQDVSRLEHQLLTERGGQVEAEV